MPAPVHWFPIDTRIIPQIFSFGHVKGIARVFLELEIVMSVGIVCGTVLYAFLSLVR